MTCIICKWQLQFMQIFMYLEHSAQNSHGYDWRNAVSRRNGIHTVCIR